MICWVLGPQVLWRGATLGRRGCRAFGVLFYGVPSPISSREVCLLGEVGFLEHLHPLDDSECY